MDPMARRMMWNYIVRVVTLNRACAMILTTHRCACNPLTRPVYGFSCTMFAGKIKCFSVLHVISSG